MNSLRLTLSVCCTIALLMSGVFVNATADAPEIRTAASIQAIERAIERLEPMHATIDRSQFEIDALARSNRSGDDLVAFVREQVRFQPYVGALKGARGALLTRSGNALDQALLTGAALEAAGIEVQLVQSTLSAELADRLLRSINSSAPEFPDGVDPGMAKRRLQAILRSLRLGEEWTESALERIDRDARETDYAAALADVDATADRLLGMLSFAPTTKSVQAELVKHARKYYWVRWRATPADPWVDAHVAFNIPDDLIIEVERTLPRPISDDLKHFVSIQVIAEAVNEGQRVERPLNRPWRQPTTALAGLPVAVTLLPADVLDAQGLWVQNQALDSVTGFRLSINGEPVIGAGSVDLAGNVPAKRESGELSDLAGGLGGALSGGLTPDSQSALSAVFVDYTFSGPAGTETVRRTILDRLGPAARAAGTVDALSEMSPAAIARAVSSERVWMLDVGAVSPAYWVDQAMGQVLDKASALQAMLSIADQTERQADWSALELERINALGHLALMTRFFDDPGADSVGLHYRPEAGLVELAVYPYRNRQGQIQSYVDIVRNPRRALVLNEAGWHADIAANLRAGVWETRMERTLALADRGKPFDTFVAFEQAAEAQLLRPGDEISSIADADLKARVMSELGAGRIVVLAETEGEHSGWWRIDPSSGQTLGMTSQGRGQSMVEYVETTVQRAQSLYGHVGTIMDVAEQLNACQEQHAGLDEFDELFCCMAAVYADTAAGPGAAQAEKTGLTGSLFITILGAAASANGGSEQICNDLIANL